jgi:hypothetical protein
MWVFIAYLADGQYKTKRDSIYMLMFVLCINIFINLLTKIFRGIKILYYLCREF